jgi:hypothetical protein
MEEPSWSLVTNFSWTEELLWLCLWVAHVWGSYNPLYLSENCLYVSICISSILGSIYKHFSGRSKISHQKTPYLRWKMNPINIRQITDKNIHGFTPWDISTLCLCKFEYLIILPSFPNPFHTRLTEKKKDDNVFTYHFVCLFVSDRILLCCPDYP